MYLVFNVSHFNASNGPSEDMTTKTRAEWPKICHYKGYRKAPDSDDPYNHTLQFWHVFTARLAFILIFEVLNNKIFLFLSLNVNIFSI